MGSPLHIAANRFKEVIRDISLIPLDSAEDIEDPVRFEEQVEYRLLLEGFMDSLSETDSRIMDAKMKGIKGKETMRIAGVCSEAYVSRRFSSIRQKYHCQVKGDSVNA